ncbi:hypothetical protein KIPB_002457 [Kipferlia bialata]|uniref:Uncharacterized protein n=1 Tax=Kipferlia bialata TaxID=797122 RepID=A0A9K3GG13_9EUKA|nr:hypothetical protein KIPB_002457 [Kipferlia bialata]|eukprot:g2457.t1
MTKQVLLALVLIALVCTVVSEDVYVDLRMAGTLTNAGYTPSMQESSVVYARDAVAGIDEIASAHIQLTVDVSDTAIVDVFVAHCASDVADVPATVVTHRTSVFSGSGTFDKEMYLTLEPLSVKNSDTSANCFGVQMTTDESALVGTGYRCTYEANALVDIEEYVALPPISGGTIPATATLVPDNYYNGQTSLWVYEDPNVYETDIQCTGRLAPGDYLEIGLAKCSGGTMTGRAAKHSASNIGVEEVGLDLGGDYNWYFTPHDGYNCWYVQYEANRDFIGSPGFSCEYTTHDFDSQRSDRPFDKDSFDSLRYVPYQYDSWVLRPDTLTAMDIQCNTDGYFTQSDFFSVYAAHCETTGHNYPVITDMVLKTQGQGVIHSFDTINLDPLYNCVLVTMETASATGVAVTQSDAPLTTTPMPILSCNYSVSSLHGATPWWGYVTASLLLLGAIGAGVYGMLRYRKKHTHHDLLEETPVDSV